jgi:hypothetical protein
MSITGQFGAKKRPPLLTAPIAAFNALIAALS